MNKFKAALMRFFSGRYGTDNLNKLLWWVWIILALINVFVNNIILAVINTLLAILVIFRMLSRNAYHRSAENRKYLQLTAKIRQKIILMKNMWRDRKTHIYRNCPHCKATLRLPYSKGKHTVCCPQCHKDFDLKI